MGNSRAILVGLAASALLVAGAWAAKGCLFVKDIEPVNRPPTAVLELTSPHDPSQIFIGTEVHLSAQSSADPEGGELVYEWSIEYDQGPAEDCGVLESTCDGGNGSTCCFIPQAKDTYTVRVRVYDPRGLRSAQTEQAEHNVEVQNRPPVAVLTAETPPNLLGHYVAGQPIWLHAFESSDPDPEAVLSFEWSSDRPSGSNTDVYVFEPSNANRQPTQNPEEAIRCRMVPDVAGSYTVHLTVSDGEDDDTVSLPIEVDPDAPPCIDITTPDASIEELLFELDEARRLQVVRVTDDLDPYPPAGAIEFTWSIEKRPGEGLRQITGHHEPYLDLDPAEYVPGQQVRVRVVIQDREERDLSGCNVNWPECNLTPGCPQWVTWNIEYR